MDDGDNELKKVWQQRTIPVVVRSDEPGVSLQVRLPFADDNRQWLEKGHRSSALWVKNERLWWLPKSWFNDLVNRALERYGCVYIVQPYRVSEVCAPACWNALGHECQCSCMGANHGTGNDSGFFVVSDSFAVKYSEKIVACRLLVAKKQFQCEPIADVR